MLQYPGPPIGYTLSGGIRQVGWMGGLEFTKNQKLALLAIIGLIVIAASIKLARNAGSARYQGVVLKEAGQGADGVGVVTSDSDPMSASGKSAGKVVFQVSGCVKSPPVSSSVSSASSVS